MKYWDRKFNYSYFLTLFLACTDVSMCPNSGENYVCSFGVCFCDTDFVLSNEACVGMVYQFALNVVNLAWICWQHRISNWKKKYFDYSLFPYHFFSDCNSATDCPNGGTNFDCTSNTCVCQSGLVEDSNDSDACVGMLYQVA